MSKLTSATPRFSFKLGFLLLGVFPTDLITSVAVGSFLAAEGLPLLDAAGFVALTLFLLALPALAVLTLGARAEALLPTARDWMNENSWIVNEVVLLFFVAIVVVFALLTVLGGAIETTIIRPLYDRPPIYQILLTFGLTLVIEEVVRIVLGVYDLQPLSDWQAALATKPQFLREPVALGPVSAGWMSLFQILLGTITVVGIWAFLTRTRYGLYIRAGSEDAEMASALGIDVRQVFTVVFALGIGLAGAAGTLLMWDPTWGASVPLAAETLLPAFIVVIVGSLGTFRGTVVAALVVGMADAVTTWWFQNFFTFTGLPELMLFLVLVVTLIVRPQGLFGVEEVGGH